MQRLLKKFFVGMWSGVKKRLSFIFMDYKRTVHEYQRRGIHSYIETPSSLVASRAATLEPLRLRFYRIKYMRWIRPNRWLVDHYYLWSGLILLKYNYMLWLIPWNEAERDGLLIHHESSFILYSTQIYPSLDIDWPKKKKWTSSMNWIGVFSEPIY